MSALPRRPVLAPPRTKLARPSPFLRSVPRSTRNMGSIRFRRKLNGINDLIFPTRNKSRGSRVRFCRLAFRICLRRGASLAAPATPAVGVPAHESQRGL